jgi:predicted RNA binding protein YcfA (HicA-like mRNA interferase family)
MGALTKKGERDTMLLTELETELARQGFEFKRQTGSHRIYADWLGRPLVISVHGRAVKHPGTIAAIRANANALRNGKHPAKWSA